MIFDLFHSIADCEINGKSLGANRTIQNFVDQAKLAESLGMDTVWLAESHFSSETQKKTSIATIPNFIGEVGLNSDSFQFIHLLHGLTKKINFGTGIHNIVGGSGGPVASAERVNFLNYINQTHWEGKRVLRMGVASGRFPYQNTPFGIIPRNETEKELWPIIKRLVFVEAIEIFLRLLRGEELASHQLESQLIEASEVEKTFKEKAITVLERYQWPLRVKPRWDFEVLKLAKLTDVQDNLKIVLGSSDPDALLMANKLWDVDLFNLSFTPPEQIEKLHERMTALCTKWGNTWTRSRLPRTVMVFIDKDRKKARELADSVLDNYIEAMRGTAQVPDKNVLLQRALVGDASEIRDQLHPENPRRFANGDRLMLWFEFNQLDGERIQNQMKYFFQDVVGGL